MTQREVLYRKWRPQTFADLIGQDHIKNTLIGALKSGKISHAYLFAGPRGTGKTTTARILTKAVNCKDPKDGEPCDKCDLCKETMAGKSLDIIEIDAASNRGIDEIRELREKIKFTPSSGKYKVFIIDEVHMLTKEAFNALLKTLEEPPEHAIFILATTEIHKVPKTIISRCQRFDFRRIKVKDLIKYLEKVCKGEGIKPESKVLELIAINSGGAMRDAVNLLDQASSFGKNITLESLQTLLGLTDVSALSKLVDLIISKNTPESLFLINELLERGYDLSQFNKKLIEYLRDILIIKESKDTDLVESTAEQLEGLQRQSEQISSSELLRIIKIFLNAGSEIITSNLPQLPLELAVVESIAMPDSAQEKREERPDNPHQENSIKPAETYIKAKKAASKDLPRQVKAGASLDPKGREENHSPEVINKSNDPKKTPKNIEDILEKWDSVLDEIKSYNHSIRAFLKASRPVDLEGDTIILEFFYPFHRERIADAKNKVIVEKVVSEVLGKDYSIKCTLSEKPKNEIKQEKSDNKNIKDDSSDDAVLKEALEVFGGEIVE